MLTRYVVAVALAPPCTFYAVRWLRPPGAKYRDARAALCAVLVLNLLLAAYVVAAFSEPEPDFVGDGGAAPPRVGIWKKRGELREE